MDLHTKMCSQCGDIVHFDYAIEGIDGDWSCEPCARWQGRQY